MGENLAEGLIRELNRNREVLAIYEELPGGVGAFGAAMIRAEIAAGEKALGSGDVVEMVRAFKILQETE